MFFLCLGEPCYIELRAKSISLLCFQWTFCIACFVVLGACAWFYVQTVSGRDGVYAAAFIMGCGNSVMLVTVLSMTADMIGIDKVRQTMTMHLMHCSELV